MDFWTWLGGVLSGGLAIAVGAGILWSVSRLVRRIGSRRGVMRVVHITGIEWRATVISRRTLFELTYTVIAAAQYATNNGPTFPLANHDLRTGTTWAMELPEGAIVHMWWIDRARWHAQFEIKGEAPIAVIPDPQPRRRLKMVAG